jgi:hypothetical protein
MPYADPGAMLDASQVIVRLANVRLGVNWLKSLPDGLLQPYLS